MLPARSSVFRQRRNGNDLISLGKNGFFAEIDDFNLIAIFETILSIGQKISFTSRDFSGRNLPPGLPEGAFVNGQLTRLFIRWQS